MSAKRAEGDSDQRDNGAEASDLSGGHVRGFENKRPGIQASASPPRKRASSNPPLARGGVSDLRSETIKTLTSLLILALVAATPAFAATPAEKGELVLEENFDGDSLAKGWAVQFGDWKPVDGVLQAKQIAADNHPAAARRALPMQDGIFEMRFRLAGEGKAFHFGFDPAPKQLDKRGHLFSVIVTPTMAKLMKHVDKDKPKEDPNEDLAVAEHAFKAGDWYRLTVEKTGNDVVARISSEEGATKLELKATHPTFHVTTPTLVFRCVGDGIEVDDLKVWKTKAS
ncbi:MAG: hypothetical protein KDN19_01980 [Verrucomicrobiae bacterium]|nr:hypothetical protein [Verrucomicrobiae bacterium]